MIRRYRHITQRPDTFRLNPDAELAQGLVFAGLAPGGLVGGTHYHDSSLYGNHGTLTNMDPATDWVFDPTLGRFSLDFDGSNDYVVVNGIANADLTYLTCAFWHNSTQSGGTSDYWYGRQCLFGCDQPGGGNAGWAIVRAKSAATVSVVSWDTVYTSTAAISTGSWVHVVYSHNGAYARIYINGTLDTEQANTSDLDNARPFYIGSQVTTSQCAQARLADVMVYDRALSLGEIRQLADPSNTLLCGLILPPRRMVFPAAVASTPPIPSGSATLSAIADLAAVGYAIHAGEAALAAVTNIEAVGYAQHSGSATLSAVASLTATGYHQSVAYATISAIADLTAVGYTQHTGSASLSAIASLSATGYAVHTGSADISAIADMVAVGESPSIIPEGSATISAVADMTAVGYASHAGEAALDAVADIAAVGYRESAGYAVLAAVAGMVAVGSVPVEEGGAGAGGKTADGLTWPDVDGLEWEEVDGLEWMEYEVSDKNVWTPKERGRTWTPKARGKTWTPAYRATTWTPKARTRSPI